MADTHRLFFALWPPAQVLAALDALAEAARAECGGRRTRRAALHLTLAFLGDVRGEQLPHLRLLTAGLGFEKFVLRLDRLGYWPHNQIVWIGCHQPPTGLLQLHAALTGALFATGFQLERRPFFAHVTLVRRARCTALPMLPGPIEWPVEQVALVESELQPAGACYRILECAPAETAKKS